MDIIENKELMNEVARISEVAGYLWEKGWAERNGGNISVNVTSLISDAEKALPAISDRVILPEPMTALCNDVFL